MERKNKIMIVIIISLIITFIVGIIIGDNFSIKYGDNTPNNPNIIRLWDCEEGCLYGGWIVYGYKNTSSFKFYEKCSNACRIGDSYFEELK